MKCFCARSGASRLLVMALLAALFSAFVVGCGGSSKSAPSITTQPVSVTTGLGTAASFSVVANGTAPLTYQWYRNGATIAGATSATYNIASVAGANLGNYFVKVSNTEGDATSNTVTLSVPGLTAPTITTQPVSQTTTETAGAAFSVVATGTAPLTYQWFHGSTAIAGATSAVYNIASATFADGGDYHVVVSNAAGDAVSDTVGLTVNAP